MKKVSVMNNLVQTLVSAKVLVRTVLILTFLFTLKSIRRALRRSLGTRVIVTLSNLFEILKLMVLVRYTIETIMRKCHRLTRREAWGRTDLSLPSLKMEILRVFHLVLVVRILRITL